MPCPRDRHADHPPPKVPETFFVPKDAQCSEMYAERNIRFHFNFFVYQNFHFEFLIQNR